MDVSFSNIEKYEGSDIPYLFPMMMEFADFLFDRKAAQCHYLPSARSGLLQGYKALASSIIKSAPLAGLEEQEIPKLSGLVSDFLSSLLDMPAKDGVFAGIAKDFESEITGGEIVFSDVDKYRYPDIQFRTGKQKIPLHRSSSTISEIAPLVLYLKHLVSINDMLIIEEPEAHLHPANQRILAKYLVRLIRKGLKLIITTHSDFLVEQISNFIALDKIDPKDRKEKYGYSEEDYISVDEVAVYAFKKDKRSNSFITERVAVDPVEGISGEEFLKVHEALYGEILKLRSDLDE
jgi:predicted ATPase